MTDTFHVLPSTLTVARALNSQAQQHDELPPFSDQSLAELAAHTASARVVAVHSEDGELLGAALLRDPQSTLSPAAAHPGASESAQPTSPAAREAELFILPQHRNRGAATALLRSLLDAETAAPAPTPASMPEPAPTHTKVWSSGESPAAAALALRFGAQPQRTLLFMTAPLDSSLDTRDAPPAGTYLRAFDPDHDTEAWLQLNGAAFAEHPEQGSVTAADLRQRMAEPWFRADLFTVLAEATPSGERMLGFSWVKSEPGAASSGEIYVIGVSPQQAGRGFGRALLRHSLAQIRELGCSQAALYVEADNEPALRLYESIGFSTAKSRVQYVHILG